MKLIHDFCRKYSRFYNIPGKSRVLLGGFCLTGNPNLNKIQNRISLRSRYFASVTCDSLSEKSVKKFLDHATKVYEGKEKDKSEIAGILKTREVEILVQERVKILENIESLEELTKNDKEMKLLAEEEFTIYSESLENLEKRLVESISVGLGRENCKDVILEISSGVGGQEAMLFANDLLEMYSNFVNYLGFTFILMEKNVTEIGGIRHASLIISGKGAYEKLRHEAGIHRVQRIPSTENSGRIHTSVVSVVIFPQPSDIEVSIHNKDLRIETFRSSGAGGQSVNKTDSAVRIVHIPTGTVVECQSERSQIQNKSIALVKLRTKIYESRLNEQVSSTKEIKRKQMGFKSRNERIRTYNFLQDRITDHRIQNGTIHGISVFLKGGSGLEELQEKLQKNFERKVLVEAVNETEGKK